MYEKEEWSVEKKYNVINHFKSKNDDELKKNVNVKLAGLVVLQLSKNLNMLCNNCLL